MNFSKYLIQYRLKKAKTLLENKDMKISFIAFEVGYNDVSHFIQSFKKSYGLTPEEYRARKKISKNKEKKLYFASKNIHKVASFIMLKSNSRKSRKVIRR